MIDSTRPDSKILWQETPEKAPEPALLIAALDGDIIEIQQEGHWIVINKESIPELCKLLKEFK